VVASPEPRVRLDRLALMLALALAPRAWAGGAAPAPPQALPAPDPEAEPHADGSERSHNGAHDEAHDHAAARIAAAGGSGRTDAFARQLADETGATDRALAVVADKLVAAQATRLRRLRAAYRLLHAVPGEDAMAAARRRAAARLLLARDGGERGLLVAEAAQLRAAHDRIAGEALQLSSIRVPAELAWPAPGKIARRFGTLEHERSRAVLARRGIDLEVEDHSPVTAPAAGTVRYAGPIRGLDQGVIIDHGTYLTVLAKLGELALPVGAPLAAGDRIGRAARHRVYLEVRVKLGPGGLPIDPEPLLGKR
jgi:murein DD-endopeptidase MepM/ murein hydrolase activator NlpD